MNEDNSQQHKQFEIETSVPKIEDFFRIQGNTLIFSGVFQTENFVVNKRGVRIRNEGLDSGGGTIQGATIGGGSASTTITGDLTHTGSKVGFNNVTPVVRASTTALTNSTGGSVSNTINDVGAAFSQTTLNNNFASLASKVNELRTILANVGLTQ